MCSQRFNLLREDLILDLKVQVDVTLPKAEVLCHVPSDKPETANGIETLAKTHFKPAGASGGIVIPLGQVGDARPGASAIPRREHTVLRYLGGKSTRIAPIA